MGPMLQTPPGPPAPASTAREDAERRGQHTSSGASAPAADPIPVRTRGAGHSIEHTSHIRARSRALAWLSSVLVHIDWRRPPRGLLVGLGAFVMLVVAGALSFGPLVRSRVAKEAERRKL